MAASTPFQPLPRPRSFHAQAPAAARAGVHYEVVAAHLQAHLFQVT